MNCRFLQNTKLIAVKQPILFILALVVFSTTLAAQQLSTFVNTQSEDGTLSTRVNYGTSVGYGEQFALLYNITNSDAGAVIPTIFLYNEDGTLDETITIPEATRSSIFSGASSPDVSEAWFAGTVDPAAGSNQATDLGIIHGDAEGFDYGTVDLGFQESLRGITATENFLYAVVTSGENPSVGGDLTLLKINDDFAVVDSIQVPAQEGLFLDYILADESEDFAFMAFAGDNGISKFVGADLAGNVLVDYTFPDLQDDCGGTAERFVRRRGGVTIPSNDIFAAFTDCGKLFFFPTNSGVIEPMGSINTVSVFSTAVFLTDDSFSTANLLVAGQSSYQSVGLELATVTVEESGEYTTPSEFINSEQVVLNANDNLLDIEDPNGGVFKIGIQGAPGAWTFITHDQVQLPTSFSTGSALFNANLLDEDLYAVAEIDSIRPANQLQRLNTSTGAVDEFFVPENTLGLSEPQLLDNGNLVVASIVRNPSFTVDAALLEIDPATGDVSTLASDSVGFGFEGAVWQRLEQLSNGDLIYVINAFSPTFAPAVQIRRFSQAGDLVYSVSVPDSVAARFVYLSPVLDADDNLYFLSPTGFSDEAYRITSLDPDGNIRYVTTNETPGFGNNSFSNHRLFFNASGQAYLTLTFSDGEKIQAVLAQIDPVTGEEIAFIPLAPELATSDIIGDFIPGTDSLLLFHTYFDESDEAIISRFLFVDEALDIFWVQEVLETNPQEQFIVNDFELTKNEGFVVGSRRIAAFDANFSTIIGVDFSDLQAVVNVDAFAQTTGLRVFPNPTAGLLHLQWEETRAGAFELEVVNLNGQQLQVQRASLNTGLNRVNIDLSTLPGGNYFLRLRTNSGVTVQPIVKQ